MGVAGAVHQVIERGDATGGHLRQRDGDLAVMHAGTGEHGTDGDVAVNGVEVRLVADPTFLMAFAVAFATHVAAGGQVGEIVSQGSRGLEFQSLGQNRRADFAFPGASAFGGLGGRRCDGFGRGSFGGFDGGGVAGDVADEFVSRVCFHHGFMDALGQLVLGKGGEGAAEGGFARNSVRAFPAAKPAECGAGFERINQRGGRGKLIDGFGDEGVGAGWTAFAAIFVTGGETPELGERDDFAELPIQAGERAEFVGEGGKELALQSVENRGQVEHDCQTPSGFNLFNPIANNPKQFEFCKSL